MLAGHRRIVHRIDGDGDDGRFGVGGCVAGDVGEAVRPVVIGVWRVVQTGHGARQFAVAGLGRDAERQRIAVHVGAGEGDGCCGVLIGRDDFGVGDGRVVQRGDREAHRGGGGVEHAVAGFEGEAVGTVEVRVGRIHQIRTGAGEQAMLGLGEDDVSEVRVLDVGRGDNHVDRGVLQRGVVRRVGHGPVVDGLDRQSDGRRGRVCGTVAHLEREAVGAVVIGRRQVGEIRRGAAQRAVSWLGEHSERERIIFDVRAGEDDRPRRVFIGGERLRFSDGPIVERAYRDADRGRRGV